MKTIARMKMDSKDDKIAHILKKYLVNKNIAKTIVFFLNTDSASSFDLERATDMRQPQASQSLSFLRRKDFLDVRIKRQDGKGRPMLIYSLKSRKMLLNWIEKQLIDMIEDTNKKLVNLNKIEQKEKNA